MSLKAQWYMTTREIKLCRMTQILFFCFGIVAGAAALLLWALNVIVIVLAVTVLYIVGDLIWERIARRILGQTLLSLAPAFRKAKS